MAGSAQPSRQLDAVAFDYGGVLTTPLRDTIAAWQAADGIDPASFTLMLKEWLSPNGQQDTPVHRLETGRCSAAQFGVLLAARLTTVDGRGIEPTGLLSRMFAAMRPDPAMFALAAELRTLGVRVALLSNSCGFVDDAMPNVEGAHAAGLPALLHTDAATTRAAIAPLVPGLAAAA